MNGGNWSVIDLTGDPVRGEPAAVRSLANASQQEASRWQGVVQSLRALAEQGGAMEMKGDFAPRARELLQAHPTDATQLAKGREVAGAALLEYGGQLEQAKRESQMALSQGTQAKRNRDMAERNLNQVRAQMRYMASQTYYGPAYYAAVQRFNMLKVQESEYMAAWEAAEAQRMAAQQRALQAGERATQQENLAAQKLSAAAPTSTPVKS